MAENNTYDWIKALAPLATTLIPMMSRGGGNSGMSGLPPEFSQLLQQQVQQNAAQQPLRNAANSMAFSMLPGWARGEGGTMNATPSVTNAPGGYQMPGGHFSQSGGINPSSFAPALGILSKVGIGAGTAGLAAPVLAMSQVMQALESPEVKQVDAYRNALIQNGRWTPELQAEFLRVKHPLQRNRTEAYREFLQKLGSM